jgi:hypothetical protein
MPRLSTRGDAPGSDLGVDLAGVVDDARRPRDENGDGDAEKSEDTFDARERDAPPERREALYAVTGHTVWLGGVCADEERILCDGANNVAMCYDFTEDPDGEGEI